MQKVQTLFFCPKIILFCSACRCICHTSHNAVYTQVSNAMPARSVNVSSAATARHNSQSQGQVAPVCYGQTAPSVIVAADLQESATGTLVGEVHISPENLASMMGIACADLAQNVTSIDMKAGMTNVPEHVGVSLFFGDPTGKPETASSFETHDRICTAYSNCNMQAVHGVINPAAGNGNTFYTEDVGSVRCSFANAKAVCETAALRATKYGDTKAITASNFASSCTKIAGSENDVRWMVPNAGFGDCAVSKLIANNIKTNAQFCDGRYNGSKAAIVNDLKGRPCTIVTSADFDTVSSAFWDKLQKKGVFSKGVTARFETMTPRGSEHISALENYATQGATASCKLVLNRPTTAATLGDAADVMVHSKDFTTAATVSGDSKGGGTTSGPMSMEELTKAVLAAKISPAKVSTAAGASASASGTVASTESHMVDLVDSAAEMAMVPVTDLDAGN